MSGTAEQTTHRDRGADTLVILPTYNERENIERILAALLRLEPPVDILVVDDASPDGTADLVAACAAENGDRIFLERRRGERGLGPAYLHGFRWALTREYAYVLEMDADFSHAPADVPRLRAACAAGADIAIGSRYVAGGGVRNWSLRRRLLSRGASTYAGSILGWSVRDATAGFVCYRRSALAALPLEQIRFVGYAFQIEMKHEAFRAGLKMVEIPIVFTDRVAGQSKLDLSILYEAVTAVWAIRFRR